MMLNNLKTITNNKNQTMRNTIIISIFTLLSAGCSRVMVPNYTTVKEIFALKKDMTMDAVNGTLGVGPSEFYTNFYDGNKVLVYKKLV